MRPDCRAKHDSDDADGFMMAERIVHPDSARSSGHPRRQLLSGADLAAAEGTGVPKLLDRFAPRLAQMPIGREDGGNPSASHISWQSVSRRPGVGRLRLDQQPRLHSRA
jgi:hypothetical protein